MARRDLTGLPTFTIDPVTARDFDAAVSCQSLGDDHRCLWVHIADVCAYVRPGGPVDREPYRRSTSIYVPGAVEPMLPEALSNDACSLRPGLDRLAVTVELELRGARTVKAASTARRFAPTSASTTTASIASSPGPRAGAQPWARPLAAARAAAAALPARREARGALAVEPVEPEFAFDRGGHVTAAATSVPTESHRLIGHLMIAANEALATVLAERGVPTLYRVHERPQPEAVQRLVGQLASLDVATPPVPDPMSPSQAAEVVAQCSLLVDQHVRRTGHGRAALTALVLRSLKQARYFPDNLGQAGLSSPRYCHFASPIRRYPDLVCHRALLSAVGGGEDAPRTSTLEEAGDWTSTRERERDGHRARRRRRRPLLLARARPLRRRVVDGLRSLAAPWSPSRRRCEAARWGAGRAGGRGPPFHRCRAPSA